jgi:WD40 repeat protein
MLWLTMLWLAILWLVMPGGSAHAEPNAQLGASPVEVFTELPFIGEITCLAIRDDGSAVLAGTEDGIVALGDSQRRTWKKVARHRDPIRQVAFTETDGIVISLGANGELRRRNTVTKKTSTVAAGDTRRALAPDGSFLEYRDGTITVFSSELTKQYSRPADLPKREWKISFDGRFVATWCGNRFTVYDCEKGKLLLQDTIEGIEDGAIDDYQLCQVFTARDSGVGVLALGIVGGLDFGLVPLNLKTGMARERIAADFAHGVDLSQDGRHCAVRYIGGSLSVIQISDGKELASMESSRSRSLTAVAISRDGKFVLAAQQNGPLRGWQLKPDEPAK